LRDRDRIYGQEFRNQVAAMNIKEVLSAPRSPWQRAYVERVIGSIRRECLDHVIVLSDSNLAPYNPSAVLLLFQKSVACTIVTMASHNFAIKISLSNAASLFSHYR
jgi:transposase InsO family protein